MTTPPSGGSPGGQPRRDIFTEFPGSDHATLIVRYPSEDGGRFSFCFADAADRLAASYRGQAPDDALLMPFLYLYRHAIELDLKHSIRLAARLRVNNSETDPTLQASALDDRLRNKHGHRLMALLEELDKHLVALEIPPVPKNVRRVLDLISRSDRSGESFRYPGSLPAGQDSIDFPALAAAIKDAYRACSATAEMLWFYEDHQQDALEEARMVQAEHLAELRSEFEADLRSEFDGYR